MIQKQCMISTTENWCPNYPDDKVELSISKLNTGNYRVAIWGQDDLGWSVDIQINSEAYSLYNKIKKRGSVSFVYLKCLGFEPF